jgi:hypothetical protein
VEHDLFFLPIADLDQGIAPGPVEPVIRFLLAHGILHLTPARSMPAPQPEEDAPGVSP